MDTLVCTVITGLGATAVMDLWGIVRQRVFGMALPNYAMVGRWLAHMPHGRFRHESMAKVPPVQGERVIGWSAHYLIGIAFATLLPLIWGDAWFNHPTMVPALVTGIATVAAPFLLMQPGMGAGIASSRTPRPGAARLQSLVTHGIFGLGLYAAGSLASVFYAP
jgi:hypothetical protein